MIRMELNGSPTLLEAEEHSKVGMRNSVRGRVWVALAITLLIIVPSPELIPISHLQYHGRLRQSHVQQSRLVDRSRHLTTKGTVLVGGWVSACKPTILSVRNSFAIELQSQVPHKFKI